MVVVSFIFFLTKIFSSLEDDSRSYLHIYIYAYMQMQTIRLCTSSYYSFGNYTYKTRGKENEETKYEVQVLA